jgi:hypothetical protein
MPQIVEKLRAEEIFPETNLYDIEPRRTRLSRLRISSRSG